MDKQCLRRVYWTSQVVLYFYDIFGTYGQMHIYGAIKEMSFKFNVLVSSRKGLTLGCICIILTEEHSNELS